MATSAKSGTREVGAFALHIQCPWKLRRDSRELTSSEDEREVGDRVLGEIWGAGDPTVLAANCLPGGAITMELTGGIRLDVTPRLEDDGEAWRLLRPYDSTPHIIWADGKIALE